MRHLALLVLGLSVPALAQPPRSFFPWWDSPIAKDLNLSEDQSKQIRSTVQEFRGKLIDQRAAVEKAELELEDEFNAESFDERKARAAVDKLVDARSNLTRSFSQMSVKLRSTLSTQQWQELQKRRPNMQPGGGPGMRMNNEMRRQRRAPGPGGGEGQPAPPPPQE